MLLAQREGREETARIIISSKKKGEKKKKEGGTGGPERVGRRKRGFLFPSPQKRLPSSKKKRGAPSKGKRWQKRALPLG